MRIFTERRADLINFLAMVIFFVLAFALDQMFSDNPTKKDGIESFAEATAVVDSKAEGQEPSSSAALEAEKSPVAVKAEKLPVAIKTDEAEKSPVADSGDDAKKAKPLLRNEALPSAKELVSAGHIRPTPDDLSFPVEALDTDKARVMYMASNKGIKTFLVEPAGAGESAGNIGRPNLQAKSQAADHDFVPFEKPHN